uniref:Paraneoplastic antigen Ma-like C-terminal domain-containing protein n=1 Tax=Pygocentrus nattereri TaxID=42514 RepID=A0AAR2IR37_PYGNA
MEFIEQSGVKVPNSVIVSGIAGSSIEEEVLTFLKKYGSINRTFMVDDPTSELHSNLIVEYTYGTAMQILEPMLPHTQTLSDESNSRYCVSALANVYCQKVGGSVTQTYLGELKRVAKLSGKDFEEMLKEALAQIGESVEASELADQKRSPEQSKEYRQLGSSPLLLLDIPREPESYKTDTTPLIIPPLSPVQKVIPSLDPGAINPPEVQKLVVEHIVRSEEKSSYAHLSLRLRTFSGKNPRPYSEADYDTWRSHVDLMMNDPSVSEIEKTRKIIESLLAPATDVIRHLGPEASPTCYLQLLDSAFGLVEDGEELFARFMNTLQNMGEKPSAYLQRLQLALSLAVRAGGVSADNADKHLLKQFCRGCWENSLLVDLQLECKRDSPPPFAELLLLLRTAEDKQEAKTLRMKQHLGAVKHKASLHQHSACECDETPTNSTQGEMIELKKQVAELKSQLTLMMTKKQERKALSRTEPSKREQLKKAETQKPDHVKKECKSPTFHC